MHSFLGTTSSLRSLGGLHGITFGGVLKMARGQHVTYGLVVDHEPTGGDSASFITKDEKPKTRLTRGNVKTLLIPILTLSLIVLVIVGSRKVLNAKEKIVIDELVVLPGIDKYDA